MPIRKGEPSCTGCVQACSIGQTDIEKMMADIRKTQENALYKSVEMESSPAIASEVVYGKNRVPHTDTTSHWVKSAMHRLDSKFDSDTAKRIRMNCQCGYGMEEKLALLKELMSNAETIEELTHSEKAKAAGLFCKDGELFLKFNVCPCPMLVGVETLETTTWCQCTTGYSKALFEKAFACNVDVELLKSIKMGDPVCLMKIILHNPIWA